MGKKCKQDRAKHADFDEENSDKSFFFQLLNTMFFFTLKHNYKLIRNIKLFRMVFAGQTNYDLHWYNIAINHVSSLQYQL